MCRDASQELGCDRRAPARARQFCGAELRAALLPGRGLDELVADAAIIGSELVTNSVNAGCGALLVSLSIHRNHLRLRVRDDAPGYPELRHPGPEEVHGRGLAITAALARSWGIEPMATGKQVWAEIAFDDALATHLDCTV
ncbi:MAG: ATP-binding protein [Jatrophihabitantaceae bacterium]